MGDIPDSHYTKSSPTDYTHSDTKTINTNTTTILLSGWGNADKCTYDIGEHRIEVYVDEYLIHTQKYNVDIAPSEKIKKEIDIAEGDLKRIRQTTYYASEFKSAVNELNELQKIKLFRGSSEKQRQIQTQQRVVDQIKIKAENEKKEISKFKKRKFTN